MPFTARKHEERNRNKDRQMYLPKLQGVAWLQKEITLSLTVNSILYSLPSNYFKGLTKYVPLVSGLPLFEWKIVELVYLSIRSLRDWTFLKSCFDHNFIPRQNYIGK